jgi:hypothetical protein
MRRMIGEVVRTMKRARECHFRCSYQRQVASRCPQARVWRIYVSEEASAGASCRALPASRLRLAASQHCPVKSASDGASICPGVRRNVEASVVHSDEIRVANLL